MYKEGNGAGPMPKAYHLSEVGLYGFPNLAKFATAITSYNPISA